MMNRKRRTEEPTQAPTRKIRPLLLTILLGCSLMLLAHTYRDPIKAAMVQTLSNYLSGRYGVSCRVGELSFSVLPLELYFRDLDVEGAYFRQRIRAGQVHVSLRNLFRPTITVNNIELRGGLLELHLDLLPAKTADDKSSQGMRLDEFLNITGLSLEHVEINDFSVSVTKQDATVTGDVGQIVIGARDRPLLNAFPTHDLLMREGKITYTGKASKTGHAIVLPRLLLSFDGKIADLSRAELIHQGIRADIRGKIALSEDFPWSASLRTLATGSALAPLLGEMSSNGLNGKATVVVEASGKGFASLPQLRANLTTHGLKFGRFSLDNIVVTAENSGSDALLLTVQDTRDGIVDVQGKAKLSLRDKLEYEGDVDARGLTLSHILAAVSASTPVIDFGIFGRIPFKGSILPFVLQAKPELRLSNFDLKAGEKRIIAVEKLNVGGDVEIFASGLQVSRALIEAGTNQVSASAHFEFGNPGHGSPGARGEQMRVDFSTQHFCADQVSPIFGLEAQGCGAIVGSVAGPYRDIALQASVAMTEASILELPLARVTGDVSYKRSAFSTLGLEAMLGKSEILAKGSVELDDGGGFNLDIGFENFALADLPKLPPKLHLGGQLDGVAQITGTFANPIIVAEVSSKHLVIQGEEFDNFLADASFQDGEIEEAHLSVSFAGGEVSLRGGGGLKRALNYETSARGVTLQKLHAATAPFAYSGQIDWNGSVTGDVKHPQADLAITLRQASFDSQALADSHLGLAYHDDVVVVKGELFGRITLDASADLAQKHLSGAVRAKAFSVENILKDRLGGNPLSTKLSAQLDIAGSYTSPDLLVGKLQISDFVATVGRFSLANASPVTVHLARQRLLLPIASLALLEQNIAIGGLIGLDGSMDLQVSSEGPLGVVNEFVPEGLTVERGAVSSELRITGNMSTPVVVGSLELHDAMLKHTAIPTPLERIGARLRFSQNMLLVEDVRAGFGEGSIIADGSVLLANFVPQYLDLSTRFSGISQNIQGVRAALNGKINASGPLHHVVLAGDVYFSSLRYEENINWKKLIVDVGKLVVAKPEAAAAEEEVKAKKDALGFDIRLHAPPSRIIIKNNLANIELMGDLAILGSSAEPVIEGAISVARGSLTFRDREFEIKRGLINFQGGKSINPTLNFQADTNIQDHLISVKVEGDAKKQTIRYSSIPFLEEPDIVSLLQFGVVSKDLGDIRMSVLQEAADFLIVGQLQDPLEKNIRKVIPIIRSIEIVPSVAAGSKSIEPLLKVESQLTPKVGLTYKAGLIGNNQQAQVDYRMSNQFSILGNWKDYRNPEDNIGRRSELSMDFRYRIEYK